MLAHDLKKILELVPEAMTFIKLASIEDDYPVDNPDSTIASGLRINYQVKVAHKPIDLETINLVKKASTLWNVQDKIDELSKGFEHKPAVMEKSAEAKVKQEIFNAKTSGFSLNFNELSKEAKQLVDNYNEHIDSEDVLRYSCQGVLNKQAALNGLESRAYVTGDEGFTKIAEALAETNTNKLTVDELQKLAELVTTMDEKAGLHLKGFNFYRESIMVKEADIKSAMTICVNGKDVPYEKIQRLGKERIGTYLGKDISDAMGKSPVEDKEVLETLPLDLQKVLHSALKNV